MTHEIVLRNLGGSALGLACECTRICGSGRVRGRWDFIETRTWMFPAAEAIAEWRSWHEREGIPL